MADQVFRVAGSNDLADGEMMAVTAGGHDILLVRIGDAYYATGGICTHALGYLDEGTLDGFEVECPLHEGRFDLRTGEATNAPATEPLRTYGVEVHGDDVMLRMLGPM